MRCAPLIFCLAMALAIGSQSATLAQPADEERTVAFSSQIRPIFARRCYACHGPSAAEGGLRLNTRAASQAELDSGDYAIVPGNVDASAIVRRLRSGDESDRMPPDGEPLPAEEIDRIETWIQQGAHWVAHWSYRMPRQPGIPRVDRRDWVRNPIDSFILKRLESAGLEPARPADRVALLRRAYYDLVGLPPTPQQVDEFLSDSSPRAFENVVDRLLNSPQYGEKWARHWLDLVRYAETNGYERDSRKDLIWRYRDYVIRAFNEDKPYDRFVLEQLAGDELPDRDADSITATGFYRLGIWDDEPVDRELARYDYLDDILRTTGEAFLGMTIGCARCHDHKIDPITQADYYAMLAFVADVSPHGKGDTNHVPLSTPDGARAMAVAEQGRHKTWILQRGNPNLKGDEVGPAFPQVLDAPSADVPQDYDTEATSGRRRVLAEWLASPDNPVTARVIVNRLWQHHFGRGLVRSSSDFGFQGTPPTHPQLLDWLAKRFVADGWRIKSMHKLIMTSSTYRMSSEGNPVALAKDPANDLFWRFNMRRLTAEEIRDSTLAVGDTLNRKMFGPSVFPPLPREVLATASRPDAAWGQSPPEEAARRSIYIHVKRSLRPPMMTSFDAPDTDTSCAARIITTVPTQALAMLNSRFMNEQASRLASRLEREHPSELRNQVARAIRLTAGRWPSENEIDEDVQFVEHLAAEEDLSSTEVLRHYCLMMLNTSEFVYLD